VYKITDAGRQSRGPGTSADGKQERNAMTTARPDPKYAHDAAAVSGLLDQISAHLASGDFAGISALYTTFVTANPRLGFFVEEALPARVKSYLLDATKAPSAFITYTLRHSTWANDLQVNIGDAERFPALLREAESGIRELAGHKTAA